MSRKARHLLVLEESKMDEFNLSKIKSRIRSIKDFRNDEIKYQANLYAISLGYKPPNKLSYEKTNQKVHNNSYA